MPKQRKYAATASQTATGMPLDRRGSPDPAAAGPRARATNVVSHPATMMPDETGSIPRQRATSDGRPGRLGHSILAQWHSTFACQGYRQARGHCLCLARSSPRPLFRRRSPRAAPVSRRHAACGNLFCGSEAFPHPPASSRFFCRRLRWLDLQPPRRQRDEGGFA